MSENMHLQNAIRELELLDKSITKNIPAISNNDDFSQEKFLTAEPEKYLPISATRSTEPDNSNTGFTGKNTILLPEYGIEWFSCLEHLSVFNRHISKALDNVINMSNTRKTISFSDKVPPKMQNAMKDYLNSKADNYYEYSGGSESLTNDLFVQAALYGATSFEMIPNETLNGIKKVARVSPKWIRFNYDDQSDGYLPVQQVRFNLQRQNLINGYIALNPTTYKYIAMRRVNESPYAMPPFLSAIEDIMVQYDMLANFKKMMNNIGLLGFLSVLVNPPKQRPGESEEDYYSRAANFLRTKVQPQVQQQIATGTAIGFKDTHDFKLQGNTMNVTGAKDLMQIVNTLIFQGLKQDPNLHGENYSTTETFGNVVMNLMSMQARNYQKCVAKSWEDIYMFDLILAGFHPGSVTVEYEVPDLKDQLKDAQTETAKILNANMKVDRGYISQDTAAQELGYDKAFNKNPPPVAIAPTGNPAAPIADQKSNNLEIKVFNEAFAENLGALATEYDYYYPEEDDGFKPLVYKKPLRFDKVVSTDFHDKKLEEFSVSYQSEIDAVFSKAIDKAATSLEADLQGRNKPTTQEQVVDLVFYHLYKNWSMNFKEPAKAVTKRNIEKCYTYYRSDKSIFQTNKKENVAASFIVPPDSMYNLTDYRTMNYLQDSDDFYMGKFITDKDTRNRITQWVNNYFIDQGNPIGSSDTAIKAFINSFKELSNMETYKIRRIVETTLNKSRNYASILYIEQAQILKYEIVEVGDRLTCEWCRSMDGKEFEVADASKMIKDVTENPVESVPEITPFATSIKIADFKLLSNAQLVSKGIQTPPFHSHCRGRIVAVI